MKKLTRSADTYVELLLVTHPNVTTTRTGSLSAGAGSLLEHCTQNPAALSALTVSVQQSQTFESVLPGSLAGTTEDKLHSSPQKVLKPQAMVSGKVYQRRKLQEVPSATAAASGSAAGNEVQCDCFSRTAVQVS